MLTTKKLADFLGVSTKTIYRIEKKGLLQSIRTPGGQRRFPYSTIKKYISRCSNTNYLKKLNNFSIKENEETYLLFDKEELKEINIDNNIAELDHLLSLDSLKKEQKDENYYNLEIWLKEWDYKNNNTNTYTHGFHSYPAKFIPQIARKLIIAFSKEYDTVCDIFCGTGTTLVESSLLNRNSIGIELNPLAVLIAKVKTTPIETETLIKKLKEIVRDYKANKNDFTIPNFKNIDFWFRKDIIKELAKLRNIIFNISEENIKNFFMISFSEVIRYASFTNDGEFKLVRSNNKLNNNFSPDIITKFIEVSKRNIIGMKDYKLQISPNVFTKVILGDATKDNGILPNSVDYIITSPPYGDSRTTVAYGQFSRLSSQWLGLLTENDKDIDSKLLGGKININLDDNILNWSPTLNFNINSIADKDEKRAKEVLSFYIDLNKALIESYKILKPKKYFTLIVGNRTVKDITLKTDMIICELAEKIGFSVHSIFYRNIPNKRMPIKNSPTNKTGKIGYTMTKESILTLKKY